MGRSLLFASRTLSSLSCCSPFSRLNSDHAAFQRSKLNSRVLHNLRESILHGPVAYSEYVAKADPEATPVSFQCRPLFREPFWTKRNHRYRPTFASLHEESFPERPGKGRLCLFFADSEVLRPSPSTESSATSSKSLFFFLVPVLAGAMRTLLNNVSRSICIVCTSFALLALNCSTFIKLRPVLELSISFAAASKSVGRSSFARRL